jgi:hypothetical protein
MFAPKKVANKIGSGTIIRSREGDFEITGGKGSSNAEVFFSGKNVETGNEVTIKLAVMYGSSIYVADGDFAQHGNWDDRKKVKEIHLLKIIT